MSTELSHLLAQPNMVHGLPEGIWEPGDVKLGQAIGISSMCLVMTLGAIVAERSTTDEAAAIKAPNPSIDVILPKEGYVLIGKNVIGVNAQGPKGKFVYVDMPRDAAHVISYTTASGAKNCKPVKEDRLCKLTRRSEEYRFRTEIANVQTKKQLRFGAYILHQFPPQGQTPIASDVETRHIVGLLN